MKAYNALLSKFLRAQHHQGGIILLDVLVVKTIKCIHTAEIFKNDPISTESVTST